MIEATDKKYFKFKRSTGEITAFHKNKSGAPLDVVIPEFIDDCKVTGIADTAFANCLRLNSISMPDSIESIGSGAFKYCANLKSVKFSKGLKTVGTFAFWMCRCLDKVELPNSVTSVGKGAFGLGGSVYMGDTDFITAV